ncbi:hypothetical protein VPH35_077735 [Triticum aestivum]
MAECSLATLGGQYRGGWTQSSAKRSPRNISIRMSKRNYIHKIPLPCHCAFTSYKFHRRGYKLETQVRCYFFQSMICLESVISPNLMLLFDEALLTGSVVFAYLAGVAPYRPTIPCTRNPSANQHLTAPISFDSGRNGKRLLDKSTSFDPNDTRNEVMAKLSEALEANGQDANGIRWLEVSIMLIDSLIEPAFMKWIEEEQALENGRIDEKLMMVISRKIKEDNWILKRFHRLGKVELYLDLLFFIRFGSARSDSYFDTKFLAENGARILEDLVIFLADVIASIYLEIMSVDGDMPTKVVGSSLALCSLSIRELQKQRNEVAINGWLHQYLKLVVSMYEDRFELHVLCKRSCNNTSYNRPNKTNCLTIAFRNPSTSTHLDYVCISPFSLPDLVHGANVFFFNLRQRINDLAEKFAAGVLAIAPFAFRINEIHST